MKLETLKTLNAERAARRAAVVVTNVATGKQRLVKAAEVARDPLKEEIEKHIRRGKSGMVEMPAALSAAISSLPINVPFFNWRIECTATPPSASATGTAPNFMNPSPVTGAARL